MIVKGIIQKWRHTYLGIFWHPFPSVMFLCHMEFFYVMASGGLYLGMMKSAACSRPNRKSTVLNFEIMKNIIFKILTFWDTFGMKTLNKVLCQKVCSFSKRSLSDQEVVRGYVVTLWGVLFSFNAGSGKCYDNKMVKATPHLFHPFVDSALVWLTNKKNNNNTLGWN